MRPESFDIQKLIDELQGTCNSLSGVLPEGMDDIDLTEQDHEAIDQRIFCCDTCDWWYEAYEQDTDGNCESCSTISDEEDEDEDEE